MTVRDVVLAVLVVAFAAFESWGCRVDRRLEAWAQGGES